METLRLSVKNAIITAQDKTLTDFTAAQLQIPLKMEIIRDVRDIIAGGMGEVVRVAKITPVDVLPFLGGSSIVDIQLRH